MSRYNDELKIKLAWQSAVEQRTCPGSDILYAETIDDNLQKHLSFCETCRENRAMQLEEKTAWQGLLDKMSGKAMQPARNIAKQEGQVWTLKKELGKWQRDGRYIQPPMVLLLSKLENETAWKVAQLYEDKRLSGDGDVPLDDRFGFAECWNCYELKEASLGLCFGCVSEENLERVFSSSLAEYPPEVDGSILSFFRSMEIEVGAFVAAAAIPELVTEGFRNEAFLQKVFGTLAEAYEKLSTFKLPEYADSLIDLLSGARNPYGVSPVVAATSVPLQVNVVIKQQDGAITIKTVGAILSESNWEDGDYYIAGKLKEVQQEDLFLVASLNVNGNVVCESQSSIENGSPYFDIIFKSVAKEASAINNLKFILVKP